MKNLRSAATPTGGSRWTDAVFLSFDNKLGGDIFLGRQDNVSALEVAESYANGGNFQLPAGVSGNLFVLIRPDDTNRNDEFPDDETMEEMEL